MSLAAILFSSMRRVGGCRRTSSPRFDDGARGSVRSCSRCVQWRRDVTVRSNCDPAAWTTAVVFVVVAIGASEVISLRAAWTRIAVRVAGSWIAATGLLLFGWSLRMHRINFAECRPSAPLDEHFPPLMDGVSIRISTLPVVLATFCQRPMISMSRPNHTQPLFFFKQMIPTSRQGPREAPVNRGSGRGATTINARSTMRR